ncbi:MAG: PGDYG domain-containing protein [Pseudomonadota bacterium]
MNHLNNIDLRTDKYSHSYIKNEIVNVCFATSRGELNSDEGLNAYNAGDALITGSTGSQWCVSRDRFNAKYEALPPLNHGENGTYRNKPIPVLAKQMNTPFSIARSEKGDVLQGFAQDWLIQYAPGDYGIVTNMRFQLVYRKA